MGWSSHLISIIKAWEYTEWRQRKLEKQMGATCDLIVRTQNRVESDERSHTALGVPPTSLCNGTTLLYRRLLLQKELGHAGVWLLFTSMR